MARSRRGITLLELLAVLSAVTVLIALALPAVLSARESSQRAQCMHRLREFGLALHGYVAANGHLPAGLHETTERGQKQYSYSPHVKLLPYLDQLNVFNRIDLSRYISVPWNPDYLPEDLNPTIPAFLCPSDSVGRGTNFRVCTGLGPSFWDTNHLPRPSQGAFSDFKGHPLARFTDGLSQTVAASERVIADNTTDTWSPTQDFWYSGVFRLLWRTPEPDEMLSACGTGSIQPPTYFPHSGKTWLKGNYAYTFYNHIAAPNSGVPDCSVENMNEMPDDTRIESGTLSGSFKASSDHRGGVNVLYVDGSVKFTHDHVDLRVWRAAAATRSRGDSPDTTDPY